MENNSQPNDKGAARASLSRKDPLVAALPRRATNVVLAATLAASMVPSAAFASFMDEVNQAMTQNQGEVSQNQDAIDQADELYAQSVAEEGTSSAVQTLATTADDTAASLDHANLPDGQYSVNIKMMNANRKQVSMANGAVGNVVGDDYWHQMTLDVVNGEYWLTMRWVPLDRMLGSTHFVGYLANLSYFEDYTTTPYIKGTQVDAKVLALCQRRRDACLRQLQRPVVVFVCRKQRVPEGRADQDLGQRSRGRLSASACVRAGHGGHHDGCWRPELLCAAGLGHSVDELPFRG
ncbi:hypothetical protein [Ellagibacter sp.]|uniref:hypothetical protein n=1 Tax=Ellagibacter sp. TaxID=2137578 RepID=UPI003AB674C4